MALRILFVDDEPEVINGYRRLFFKLRNEWDQHFASSGEEALKIIEQNKIDVVVSDMRMPGMDGDELLTIIQNKHPQILRIILSGHQNQIKIIKSLSSAHQFLIKPCTPEQLNKAISNAYSLRKLVEDKNTINFVNGLNNIPSLPDIYIRLEKELNKDEVSFSNVENILIQDPAITAKILQVVNSGFFGIPRKISSLMDALNLLGINLVKSIILYLETFSTQKYDSETSKYISQIGKHSIKAAEIGRMICKFEKLGKEHLDDIFISCILHDIGKLILLNNRDYIKNVNELCESKGLKWSEAEVELYGYTHSGVGAYLIGIWGLPIEIMQAVAFHHNPADLICDDHCIPAIVHIANAFANYNGKEFDFEKLELDKLFVEDMIGKAKLSYWWREYNNMGI